MFYEKYDFQNKQNLVRRVALLYIFAILFMSDPREGSQIPLPAWIQSVAIAYLL